MCTTHWALPWVVGYSCPPCALLLLEVLHRMQDEEGSVIGGR